MTLSVAEWEIMRPHMHKHETVVIVCVCGECEHVREPCVGSCEILCCVCTPRSNAGAGQAGGEGPAPSPEALLRGRRVSVLSKSSEPLPPGLTLTSVCSRTMGVRVSPVALPPCQDSVLCTGCQPMLLPPHSWTQDGGKGTPESLAKPATSGTGGSPGCWLGQGLQFQFGSLSVGDSPVLIAKQNKIKP